MQVHVVYYLSCNSLLEHLHYVEITLFPNDPLRLKDVFERLTSLRGSGIPLQYSWSCKRNYKSGYVWCDLALNDIIHPAEGAKYILKGSELVQASSGYSSPLYNFILSSLLLNFWDKRNREISSLIASSTSSSSMVSKTSDSASKLRKKHGESANDGVGGSLLMKINQLRKQIQAERIVFVKVSRQLCLCPFCRCVCWPKKLCLGP
ncbi:hypothetical protein Ahy_A02g006925 isoform A [Arachis hypogaea]|uniref:SOSEKI DIX-like domain-containing protein n=1 Tax=Arachis hypogaea TaxID=3818 RepID=A0A445EB34_ARAHY|nr:hypothetical protein Ahy_A02g006925 isoform A [Arachis hypogaea]